MPVKRRHSKRTIEADVEAWSGFFEFGCDMLHQLHPMPEEEIKAAAPEAWERLGARFLETRKPNERWPRAWAQDAYGEPPRCR